MKLFKKEPYDKQQVEDFKAEESKIISEALKNNEQQKNREAAMRALDQDEKNIEVSEMLKALAHPVRLCIVRGLIENKGCNVSHMERCMEASQSSISQYLAKLKAAGIVSSTRDGNVVNYEVCNQQVIDLVNILFKEQK